LVYFANFQKLTSFQGRSLAAKFPNNVALRNQHLPIFPSIPHPEHGLQLFLDQGLELRKPSYVKITCCYTIDYRLLQGYDYHRTSYRLCPDSMKELLACIGLTLPRRLREVLDYQPVKDNYAVNAYRAGLPNTVADIEMVAHCALVDTHSRETLKPTDFAAF